MVLSQRPSSSSSSSSSSKMLSFRSCSYFRCVVLSLLLFWFIGFHLYLSSTTTTATTRTLSPIPKKKEENYLQTKTNHKNNIIVDNQIDKIKQQQQQRPPPLPLPTVKLLSRDDNQVVVTADVRGNLGPPSVLIQSTPGTDWIKDRWQAASNMHGTAIPGIHWIQLDFSAHHSNKVFYVHHVVLDWEAAFSKDYKIELSMDGQTWNTLFDTNDKSQNNSKQHNENNNNNNNNNYQQSTKNNNENNLLKVETSGQSPGVKTTTPLHVIHTIGPFDGGGGSHHENIEKYAFRYLRVWIRKSAMGWGVSLWQVDVYGTEEIEEETIKQQ